MTSTTPSKPKHCTHPTAWNGMCMLCGAFVSNTSARVDDSCGISLSHDRAAELRQRVDSALLASRKLRLILDLDETLIHTRPLPPGTAPDTPDTTTAKKDKEEGNGKEQDASETSDAPTKLPETTTIQLPDGTMHLLAVRPHLAEFLARTSREFELRLYTSGVRCYADAVLRVIDPTGVYFGHGAAVISRNDNPQRFCERRSAGGAGGYDVLPRNTFTKESTETVVVNRKEIVPSLGSPLFAVVVDDRDDIWGKNAANLLQIFPCLFHHRPHHTFTVHSVDSLSGGIVRQMCQRNGTYQESVSTTCSGWPTSCTQSTPSSLPELTEEFLMLMFGFVVERHIPIFVHNLIHVLMLEQDVISDLRDHVLSGKVIAFSRVFPISENSQQQFLWQSALTCGAECQEKVTPEVTHLVTTSGDTDKCREAMKQPSTFIVNVDWLVEAVMKWHLVDERNYQIPGCERRIPSFLLAAEKRPRPQDDSHEDSQGKGDEPPEKMQHATEESNANEQNEDDSECLEFLQLLEEGSTPESNNS